ncbi:MAG: hypothetical protein ACUVWR_18040 [Anaerolineae bacterium]
MTVPEPSFLRQHVILGEAVPDCLAADIHCYLDSVGAFDILLYRLDKVVAIMIALAWTCSTPAISYFLGDYHPGHT